MNNVIKTKYCEPPTVEFKNVSKKYGKFSAVDGISFQLAKGETLALTGPSGCGKTTVLRLIAGLEKPDWGEVWVNGVCASSATTMMPPYDRNLAMVFQDLALWPHMTTEQNIAFGLDKKLYRGADRESRIDELLQLVRMENKENYPHQLSGGEQQRLAIARSLAQGSDILLLDEPFSNLDENLKKHLLRDLKRLFTQLRTTVIHVTHQWEEAVFMADRVATMRSGKIISQRDSKSYAGQRSGNNFKKIDIVQNKQAINKASLKSKP